MKRKEWHDQTMNEMKWNDENKNHTEKITELPLEWVTHIQNIQKNAYKFHSNNDTSVEEKQKVVE